MCDVMNKKFGIKGESATWKMIALFTFHKRVCQDKCVSFFNFFPAVPVPDRAVSVRDTD